MGYMEWIPTWEPVPRWEPWPDWDFLAEPLQEGEGPFCSSLCECNRIAMQLNIRPRKRLGFRTPEECYGR